jgi:hypothetical protein
MKATLLYRVLFLLPGMAPRRRRQECAGHFGLTRLRLLCSAIRGFDDELQILRPPGKHIRPVTVVVLGMGCLACRKERLAYRFLDKCDVPYRSAIIGEPHRWLGREPRFL